MTKKAIGVFDSGIGGLTVLDDLVNKYPSEDFIYLADIANCPYGEKSKREVEEIVTKNVNYFIKENVKAIIIACNTASANSYHLNCEVPIIRIIEPTAQRVNQLKLKTALLATDLTIESRVYHNLIEDQLIGIKCSDFVEIVETKRYNTDYSREIVKNKLQEYQNQVQAIILGCTHFGLLTEEIKAVMGDIIIIDSSLSIAPSLHKIIPLNDNYRGKIYLKTTSCPQNLNLDWFEHPIKSIEKIKIE